MKIHWGRILIAGFVAEELQLASVLFSHRYGSLAMTIVALLSSFVFMLLGALWVARIIKSRFILHGTLVGVFAMVFFIPTVMVLLENNSFQSFPPFTFPQAALVAHFLKILGGATGGFLAGRRRMKP